MKLRTQLFLGYTLVFALMLVIAAVSYTGFRSHMKTARWVAHTHEAISQAHFIEKLLLDMETGQRGFLLTGEEAFLEPYHVGREHYLRALEALQLHVSDNSVQVTRLKRIDGLVAKWQSVAAEPEIEARKRVIKGAIDAEYLQDLLAAGEGKGILDEMRAIMDVMNEQFRLDGNMKGEALTEAVAKAMVDSETGERGFLITGKDDFLAPFRDGKTDVKSSIENLRSLVANAHDRIATVHNIDALEQHAARWLREAGEPEIQMRREVDQGKRPQKDLENTLNRGRGKSILDEMRQIVHRMDTMFATAENATGDGLLIRALKAMVDQETGQRGFLLTGNDAFLRPLYDGQKTFAATLLALRKLNANAYDVPGMKRDIRRLEQLSGAWLTKAAQPEIAFRRQMNQSTSSMKTIHALIIAGTGKAVMDMLRRELGEFISIEEALLRERESAAGHTANRNTFTVIFGTLIAIALGLSGMLFTSRSIQRRVGGEPDVIAALTKRIAQGDLDVEIEGAQTRTGIFASVATMAMSLKEHRDVTARQEWLTMGQNQLNEAHGSLASFTTASDCR